MIKRIKKILLSLVCVFWCGITYADSQYPNKPLKMYIGFSAGSATDIVGRVIADALAKRLNQPVIVENKVGAGGSIAAKDTAKSPSDGYTILIVSSAIAVNPAVYKGADEVVEQLKPIALIGYLPTVLMASSEFPAKNMREFIEYAKNNPNKVNYGSSGIGGSTQMAMEAFSEVTGIKLSHIPFKGNAQASAALMGNQIDAMMDTLLLASPVIKGGKGKGLAISGSQRSALIPNVPTFAEAGVPGYNTGLFFGAMGPAGLSDELTSKLNKEINEALKEPSVRERLIQTGGLTLEPGSPQDFKKILNEEIALWQRIAKSAGIARQ